MMCACHIARPLMQHLSVPICLAIALCMSASRTPRDRSGRTGMARRAAEMERQIEELEDTLSEVLHRLERMERANLSHDRALDRLHRGAQRCDKKCPKTTTQEHPQGSPAALRGELPTHIHCLAICELDMWHQGGCAYGCSPWCASQECTHCVDDPWEAQRLNNMRLPPSQEPLRTPGAAWGAGTAAGVSSSAEGPPPAAAQGGNEKMQIDGGSTSGGVASEPPMKGACPAAAGASPKRPSPADKAKAAGLPHPKAIANGLFPECDEMQGDDKDNAQQGTAEWGADRPAKPLPPCDMPTDGTDLVFNKFGLGPPPPKAPPTPPAGSSRVAYKCYVHDSQCHWVQEQPAPDPWYTGQEATGDGLKKAEGDPWTEQTGTTAERQWEHIGGNRKGAADL